MNPWNPTCELPAVHSPPPPAASCSSPCRRPCSGGTSGSSGSCLAGSGVPTVSTTLWLSVSVSKMVSFFLNLLSVLKDDHFSKLTFQASVLLTFFSLTYHHKHLLNSFLVHNYHSISSLLIITKHF